MKVTFVATMIDILVPHHYNFDILAKFEVARFARIIQATASAVACLSDILTCVFAAFVSDPYLDMKGP